MRRSNCVAYVIGQWISCGGYVMITRSSRWWGVHVLWMNRERTEIRDYQPIHPHRWFNTYVPKLWFEGRVRFVKMR